MGFYTNIDLLFLGAVIAMISTLGFMVYFSEQKNTTARAFLFFSLVTIIWGVANYVSYQSREEITTLWMLRVLISLAVWHAFSLFHLVYVYPKEDAVLSKSYKYVLIPIVLLTSILNLTPLVFPGIATIATEGASVAEKGPGIIFFLVVILFLTAGIFRMSFKHVRSSQGDEKRRAKSMFLGILSTFGLLAVFNFGLPALLDYPRFIPYGAAFILPTIILTSYAILRHRIFNVKIFTTGFLTASLAILSFLQVFFSASLDLKILNSIIFILVLVAGIILIRGVNREVEQREEIQKLAGELQTANDQQTVLIHFITHQVKGFFTMSRNIFSLMLEDTFGTLNPEMRKFAQQGFDNTTKGVTTVQDILSASNIKKGTVAMNMAQFDLRALIDEVLSELKPRFDSKGLQLATVLSSGPILVKGDRFQLHEVYKNLIDNAIRYTPKGTVAIKLEKKDTVAHFEVKDSGVGLTDEDKKKLFTEGGRGKESLKVNVDSTGFGLFIVKGIVDQHKGQVRADSEGPGKGSTFSVEIPLVV